MMTKEDMLKQFGTNLEQILHNSAMTERELAKALGTQSHVIYSYERGNKDPKMHRAAIMARILDTTVAGLLTGSKRAKKKSLKGEVLPVEEFNKELIKQLNEALRNSSVNINQLSLKTGINSGTITNVLAGKRQPRLSTVVLMALGMDTKLEQIVPNLVIS